MAVDGAGFSAEVIYEIPTMVEFKAIPRRNYFSGRMVWTEKGIDSVIEENDSEVAVAVSKKY
ncbi:hypothetical protein [Lentibacillus juripiscarius]|uniref:hypothetical protein n=1 Tax=Lentibacillus juripiscarius TaxID=257446 RepID=UPI0036D3A948